MTSNQCEAILGSNKRCGARVKDGSFCYRHGGIRKTEKKICNKIMEKGKQCNNDIWGIDGNYCFVHAGNEKKKSGPKCGANTIKGGKCSNKVQKDGNHCVRHDQSKRNKSKMKNKSRNSIDLEEEVNNLKSSLIELMELTADMVGFRQGDSLVLEDFRDLYGAVADFSDNISGGTT